jgi:serine phosphatase RsbU (regulator of sigma subunit)/DNA-binding LacI/PurR family transcriptional regulator
VLYDLIHPKRLDGMLIFSSTVGWYLDREGLAAFCGRYHLLPQVSMDAVVAGIHSVIKGNYAGIRDAMSHLITGHGYRRIAFLRGPENILWSQERYRAYTETLTAYGLPVDPILISPPLQRWDQETAVRLMEYLVHERQLRPGQDFEAVVAATDNLARNAIRVLQANGLRVPQNVAVTGFDDEQESWVMTPPLTTVQNGMYEMGWKGVEGLLAQLRGEEVPAEVVIPAKLVVRQSCGCQSPAVLHADAESENVLAKGLPRLNIPGVYLSLYENPKVPTEWAKLMLAYNTQGQIELTPNGQCFPSPHLVPDGMLLGERPHHLVVELFYFRETHIGFVLFEVGPRHGKVYEALRSEISLSALQGALLVQQVQQHAHELAAAYEEIKILNHQLQEENLRMSAELHVSRRIQQMVLPSTDELRQIEGLEIVGYMKPADEVGGDYYDVLSANNVIHIGIGDVTGHGLESGVLMLMTQTAIRTLIERGETDPVAFLSTLNRVILKNAQRMQADKTLTLVFVNYQHGTLKIVGQHEEVLVVRNSGQVERVDTMNLGFPIGLEESIADFVGEATVSLQPGESVVLYTDGITEAENAEKTLYGIERLYDVISRYWDQSAEAIKQAAVDDVTRFIGQQNIYDDLTIMVLKQK